MYFPYFRGRQYFLLRKTVNLYCYCMTSRSTLTPLLLLFKPQTLTLVCRLRKRGMESNNIRIEAT